KRDWSSDVCSSDLRVVDAPSSKEPDMSGERRSASDERRSRAGLGDRWRMTLSALVAVVAGLALGVFMFDSVPAALMTTLLLAIAMVFSVRSDQRRSERQGPAPTRPASAHRPTGAAPGAPSRAGPPAAW